MSSEFWQQVHREGRYDPHNIHPFLLREINDIIGQALQDDLNLKVLEVGSGNGRIACYIKDRVPRLDKLVVTDISQASVVSLIRSGLEAYQADMRDCPVLSGEITHAISWRVIHCLNYQGRQEAVGELRRVVKSGGSLLLAARSVFDRFYGFGEQTEQGSFVIVTANQMPQGRVFNPRYPPHVWHFFSADELVKLLEKSGFSVEQLELIHEIPGTFKHLPNDKNTYWALRAVREERALAWSGFGFSTPLSRSDL